MLLTPADLDRIEALARAATTGKRSIQWGVPVGVPVMASSARVQSIDADGTPVICTDGCPDSDPDWLAVDPRDAAFIAALDPDTVLALVEAARKLERVEAAARELVERLGQMKGPTFREALESGNPEAYGISNPWAIAEGRATGDERVSMREIASDLAAALRDDVETDGPREADHLDEYTARQRAEAEGEREDP